MDPTQASDFQRVLDELMETVRSKPTLTSEVCRAEREFFQANPGARDHDPSAMMRFCEWFLLERESDVIGGVPVRLLPMPAADRQRLEDSLVGVFQIQGSNTDEYVVVDLQGDTSHDVAHVEGVTLSTGDLLIGRLFEGPLDVYVASVSMAYQRDARALAAAFTKDTQAMNLGRRLSQAELEHLLFRGRSQAPEGEPTAVPVGVPLEHLEADLEKCLVAGGISPDLLSATSISASLGGIPRPGLIIDPLLEKLAFDSEVDLEDARAVLLQIWERRQSEDQEIHRSSQGVSAGEGPDESDPSMPEGDPETARPEVGERAVPDAGDATQGRPARPPDEGSSGLGASVRARIEAGLADGQDLEQVFAEADEMVGGGESPESEDRIRVDGNLRPLIAEYLWETKAGKDGDTDVLEQLVSIQCEAPVPHMDLDELSLTDVLRLMMQTYLASVPGERTARVGEVFVVLERFFQWAVSTQGFALQPLLDGLRTEFVDHVPRLEAAGLALSAGGAAADTSRDLYRVVAVAQGSLEIVAEEGDTLLRVPTSAAGGDQLQPEDLLLASMRVTGENSATLVGMVIAMPPVARGLLG